MKAKDLIRRYRSSVSPYFHGSAKPYVRWWWLAGPFLEEDLARQLQWVRAMGFGGVEIAWIYPSWLADDPGLRPLWLGAEWQDRVNLAKRTADELGLGCDFTFGSCWPFGGSWLKGEDAAQTFTGGSDQRLGCSWEQDEVEAIPVLNHLSAAAFEHYAQPLLEALRPALSGSTSGLFCDSLELRTEAMWSRELWQTFEQRFGYSLEPFASRLDEEPQVRYDYRRLIADTILKEFYHAFAGLCGRNNSYARVQCHGAPVDLLAAYAAVGVPESEALLFPPAFSRIAASAAAWAGKPVVSAEAFTCLYGFTDWDESAEIYWRRENLADLKLLAGSLFANGVNQIVWHGMPYQPASCEIEFYASVHVGPDSAWVEDLPAFNKYLEEVSAVMQLGRAYGRLGVYLPFEDALMKDRLAAGERTPGANYHWEMRHAAVSAATEGFCPLWVSGSFLREARAEGGLISSRELSLEALYVDCEWLDADALADLVRLAEEGASIIYPRQSKQPGLCRSNDSYGAQLVRLRDAGTVSTNLQDLLPLVRGDNLPFYFGRQLSGHLLLFFSHPLAREIKYPMEWGAGKQAGERELNITVNWCGREEIFKMVFEPCESLLLLVNSQGSITKVDPSNFRP